MNKLNDNTSGDVRMYGINSAEDIAFVADYAEVSISEAASIKVEGNTIYINHNTVSQTRVDYGRSLEETALEALHDTESLIENLLASQDNQNYQELPRGLFSTVVFRNIGNGELRIIIDPDIRYINVDIIKVETPLFSLSFSPSKLGNELTEALVISLEDISQHADPEVKVTMNNNNLTNTMTLSLISEGKDSPDIAIIDTNQRAYSTHYNNITREVEGFICGNGVYKVSYNKSNFQDTQSLSEKEQDAISAMVAKGITTGTSVTTYSPNDPITRGQFVTFLLRCLGVRSVWNAESKFSDIHDSSGQ